MSSAIQTAVLQQISALNSLHIPCLHHPSTVSVCHISF